MTFFGPDLNSALGGFDRNAYTYVRGHKFVISTKYYKYPPSRSVVKADYVFP